jgi:hypothetical protein
MLEIQESVSIEALQSIDGRNPYVTLFILNNLVNHVEASPLEGVMCWKE